MNTRTARHGLLLAGLSLATTLTAKEWTATLAPIGESMVRGTATVSSLPGDSLSITVTVEGVTMGDSHPWHLHDGACGQSGAILGGAASYPPVRGADDKGGMASTRVKLILKPDAAYSINVHRSSSDQAAIACGNLQPVMSGVAP